MREHNKIGSHHQYWIDQCAEEVGRQIDCPYKAFWAIHQHRESLAALHAAAFFVRLKTGGIPAVRTVRAV